MYTVTHLKDEFAIINNTNCSICQVHTQNQKQLTFLELKNVLKAICWTGLPQAQLKH